MSKYAVLSLSEALEHELEGTNVGVSVLCPGPANTNIPRGARNRPEYMGAPQLRADEEAVLGERLATRGLDPKKVGERVVEPTVRIRFPRARRHRRTVLLRRNAVTTLTTGAC
jgi:short-subunit dehydrogenase